jgi:hypothetical protein
VQRTAASVTSSAALYPPALALMGYYPHAKRMDRQSPGPSAGQAVTHCPVSDIAATQTLNILRLKSKLLICLAPTRRRFLIEWMAHYFVVGRCI